jgi:hypothetical protein
LIEVTFAERADKSWIAPGCGNLVRAWQSRPGHAPTSPVGYDISAGANQQ